LATTQGEMTNLSYFFLNRDRQSTNTLTYKKMSSLVPQPLKVIVVEDQSNRKSF